MYKGDIEKCVFCESNSQCIVTKSDKKRGYRTIERDQFFDYRQEMKDRKASAPTRIAQAQAAEANLHPATPAPEG